MIHYLRFFQDRAVKMLLYMAAFGSMLVDRVCPGGDGLEIMTAEAHAPSPQEMLVRLTTIMIAGSLTMLALAYSAPPRTLPG